ncbi:four helix bundle protein [Pedobacter rhizosphaerae]|uniref:Four helix bundle protein n=2 Tax=Pedobacter rhizosphaerae TaxID=390241 RepID=A0A1H9ULR4_9SPHI|nr:four helix bundle protein [Pedobacter rhizosphaerae]
MFIKSNVMYVYSFEKLETWQKARIFRKEIYLLTKKFPKEEIFGLTSQVKRSVSSISDCLAEGSSRITAKDQAHFASMAYASAIETINHLIGAHDLEYISDDDYYAFRLKLEELTNKINALRTAILNRA